MMEVSEWEPTRWWRAVAPDGSVRAESSGEREIRDLMRPGDRLMRLNRAVITRWVVIDQ